MTDPHTPPDPLSDETPKERVNRELIELLQGLRVALPDVQVLFGHRLRALHDKIMKVVPKPGRHATGSRGCPRG